MFLILCGTKSSIHLVRSNPIDGSRGYIQVKILIKIVKILKFYYLQVTSFVILYLFPLFHSCLKDNRVVGQYGVVRYMGSIIKHQTEYV